MRLHSALPFALVLAAALSQAEPVALKRTPKVGDKATYRVAATLQLMGMDVSLKGTTVEEVVKVEGDVATTKSTSRLTFSAGGQEQEAPESTDTAREKLDGTPLPDEDEQGEKRAGSLRRANVTQVRLPEKPVSVGDSWTVEEKKDEKAGVPGFKLTFKLEGEEKVGTADAWKVSAEGAETEGSAPTHVKTTVWLDKTTGRMLKTVSAVENLVIDAGTPPMSGKLEVTIQP